MSFLSLTRKAIHLEILTYLFFNFVAFVSTLKYIISNRRYKLMDKNENINLPTKVTITLDL
ncbi:MAG: hypothetical protein N4R26_02635, partial [Lactobacillus iners]|nr:hypothetical protein [Lactobacillus iners]